MYSYLCLFVCDDDVSVSCPVCKVYVRAGEVEDDDDCTYVCVYEDHPLLHIVGVVVVFVLVIHSLCGVHCVENDLVVLLAFLRTVHSEQTH